MENTEKTDSRFLPVPPIRKGRLLVARAASLSCCTGVAKLDVRGGGENARTGGGLAFVCLLEVREGIDRGGPERTDEMDAFEEEALVDEEEEVTVAVL